ncbi:hypothetical protein QQF64_026140 [Cirrhinus molitorella]|uniref:Integrase catalytic domain-containing protein n=1 Tax=Cirrhinus molitorella TaxID=172907 RepID=A0ABR3NR02_9TELE
MLLILLCIAGRSKRECANRYCKAKNEDENLWCDVQLYGFKSSTDIDIVEDLSPEGFLKAYQRFTALRGQPRKLWSDQGTNFVGARPVLHELYEFLSNIGKDHVQKKAVVRGTDWTWVFHPVDSPHWNGAAEAAVRVLKRVSKGSPPWCVSVNKGSRLSLLPSFPRLVVCFGKGGRNVIKDNVCCFGH